jgi:hypothetical protein
VKKAPPTIPTAAAAGKEADFATLRPFQLKSQLKTRNLPVDGTKEEMVERLEAYERGEYEPPAPAAGAVMAGGVVAGAGGGEFAGCTMRAVKAPPLQAEVEKSSRLGNLKKGDEFVVLESAVDAAGTTRLRLDRGWVSLTNTNGAALVERVAAPGAAAVAAAAPAATPASPRPALSGDPFKDGMAVRRVRWDVGHY